MLPDAPLIKGRLLAVHITRGVSELMGSALDLPKCFLFDASRWLRRRG